jgi:hypothetical protein
VVADERQPPLNSGQGENDLKDALEVTDASVTSEPSAKDLEAALMQPAVKVRSHLRELFGRPENSGAINACNTVDDLRQHVVRASHDLGLNPMKVWPKIERRNWIEINPDGYFQVSPH